MHERAGQAAEPQDLIDLTALLRAFAEITPDPENPTQRVVFGTSGHRGTAFNGSFNSAHIAAICAAIAEYRADAGIRGPLFLGGDTHALSAPALSVAEQVFSALGVQLLVAPGTGEATFVPTPAISRAILAHNQSLPADSPDRADGVVVTPSHNPPQDGGIKYNPPHGGPADSDATGWIAERANEILYSRHLAQKETASQNPVEWILQHTALSQQGATVRAASREPQVYDFLGNYVSALPTVIDLAAIRDAGVRIGAHPLGGASQAYWQAIRETHGIDVTVLGPGIDPCFAFMHLDWDGQIRMDPSSPSVMATALPYAKDYDIVTGNDADADRHGIITPDAGLMNPNHFLAVAIDYLLTHRPDWPVTAGVGKTLVSSSLIDRVVRSHGRTLHEVPVGFKWFVSGLASGDLVFGGEESAGAAFQCFDGTAWSTDKDGILLALLAAEIQAVTGKSPSERYRELTALHGEPAYERVDAAASTAQKSALSALQADAVTDNQLAGDKILFVRTESPSGDPIGGLKVETEHAWFAARPSGTEDVMKIYAESFKGAAHLREVQAAATALVQRAIG